MPPRVDGEHADGARQPIDFARILLVEAAKPVGLVEKPRVYLHLSARISETGRRNGDFLEPGQTALRRVPGKGDQGAPHLVELIAKTARGIEDKPPGAAAWLNHRKRRIERGKPARVGIEAIDEHLIDP